MRNLLLAATLFSLPSFVVAATIDFREGGPVTTIGNQPAGVGLVGYDSAGAIECGYFQACRENSGYVFGGSQYHDAPGISLDDDGGGASRTWVYRPDGKRFSVKSVLVGTNAWSLEKIGSGPNPAVYVPEWDDYDFESVEYAAWKTAGVYDGILYGIYGVRDGVTVGSYEFGTDVQGTIRLGKDFNKIDYLKFAIVLPPDLACRLNCDQGYKEVLVNGATKWVMYEPGDVWCWDYCTVMGITSMKAVAHGRNEPAAVPLPASIPLLFGALTLLALLRRPARKT